MNTVEIKFDESKNIYLRVNHGEWLVKNWDETTAYERILIRSLQPESNSNIVSDKIQFEV
jgi:hypothetical protein